MYDFLMIANMPLFETDGGAKGGTERQIITVAERLAEEGLNVGIVHSLNGHDQVINGVKHLDHFRHYYAKSKVRLDCNKLAYAGNCFLGYQMFNPYIRALSPIELNSSEKTFIWMHNWSECHVEAPRIFLSHALEKYVQHRSEKVKGDKTIHYMVPKGVDTQPIKKKRGDYLFWMSAYGKGFKESIMTYIALYDKGMKRPYYVCCPPQRQRRDVSIFTDTIEKANKHGYPIHFLGELSYEAVLKNLSNSACLFRMGMPQETFGLVYLEANKLGVPVITHEQDAAEEILTDKNNMFVRDHTTLDDIYAWMLDVDKRQTKVDMKKFDPDLIVKKWLELMK